MCKKLYDGPKTSCPWEKTNWLCARGYVLMKMLKLSVHFLVSVLSHVAWREERGSRRGRGISRLWCEITLSLSLSLSLSHADFRTRLGAVRKLAKVMLRESVARPQLCVRTPCHGMVELCTVVGRQNSIFGMRRML